MTSRDPIEHRLDYDLGALGDDARALDPIDLLRRWLDEAADLAEPNAMVVSTAGADGAPTSRTVLLRGLDADGTLWFFTNRRSRKGRELAQNPRISLLFPWYALQRQVIVLGTVTELDPVRDDAYFATRPRRSQLSAWASEQSEPIGSRVDLERRMDAVAARHPDGTDVPRPAHWGGYRVHPTEIEFWQGRRSRLHDRLVFLRASDSDPWAPLRRQP